MQPEPQAKPDTVIMDDDELLAALDLRCRKKLLAYFRNRHFSGDVRDLVQETFRRVIAAMRGGMRPDSLEAFSLHLAGFVAREEQRREKQQRQREGELTPHNDPPDQHDMERALLNLERRRIYLAALKQLSPYEQTIITRVIVNEEERDQVCRDLDINRNVLRIALHRALKKLEQLAHQELEPKGEPPDSNLER